jgi:hypothetical protein
VTIVVMPSAQERLAARARRISAMSGSADDMATKPAQELGLTTAKVNAALAKYMPQGGGQAPPSATQS